MFVFDTGNKSDLEEMRVVENADAKALAQHHGMLEFLETSAKDSTNIEQTFHRLAVELKRRHAGGANLEAGDTQKLNFNSSSVTGWGCCGTS